jgi:hypothetical protein
MVMKKTPETTASTSSATPKPAPRRRATVRTMRDAQGHGEPMAPSHNDIAEAAYHRYLNRGGGHGRDADDWFEAERELHGLRRPAQKTSE